MKLHFESDLTYQQNAIKSVCDLFKGQEKWESEMTVLAPAQGALSFEGATGSMPVNPQIPEDDVLLKNLEPIPKGIVINKQRSFLGAKNGG